MIMHRFGLLSIVVWALAGCIEPFTGSHIQFTLSDVKTPCKAMITAQLPGFDKCQQDADGNVVDEMGQRFMAHYEMWASVNSGVVYLDSFTVQRHLFPDEQIDLEQKGVILSNGKPFKVAGEEGKALAEMTADERDHVDNQMRLANQVLAMTSFSHMQYEASNPKKLYEDFFLGSYRQLTFPHNGIYYGQVEGPHPYGPGLTLSGGSIRLDPNLEHADGMFVTIETKNPNRPNPQPSEMIYLRSMESKQVRGAIHFSATSPVDAHARGTFLIIPNLGERDYF
jgi:hypothetical protein